MRGFFCVGLVRPKTAENVGGVMRAAQCYGAAQVILERCRSADLSHCLNTGRAERHVPTHFADDVLDYRPHDTQVVCIDLVPGAVSLTSFQHPERALYVFGPEDGTLGARHLSRAQHVVYVPTRMCMNLAACVNVVLYDRMAKALRDRGERLPRIAGSAA